MWSDLIRQKMKWIIYAVFLLVLFLYSAPIQAKEHEGQKNEASMRKGVVSYSTIDTTASTDTTWGTVGFTVRNGRTGGNPIEDKNYGTFDLAKGDKKSFQKGGVTTTTFKFSGDKVNDEFEDAKVNSVSLDKNGGNVYLNAIIQVYYSGKPHGKPKNTLTSIMAAETWGNPKDFYDRFDIKLPYDPVPQPVHLTLMKYTSNGYKEVNIKGVSGECTRLPTHDRYKTNTSTIPGTIPSNTSGNTLYLYRVYWARLKEEKHQYNPKGDSYRKPRDKISIDSSVNPLVDWEGYKAALQPLRIRSGESTDKYTNQCPFYEVVYGGIEIVCVYRSFKTPIHGGGTSDELKEDIIEPYCVGTIQADKRFQEAFNSEQGIPTTETQYVCAYTDEYLLQYKFVHYSGWQEF